MAAAAQLLALPLTAALLLSESESLRQVQAAAEPVELQPLDGRLAGHVVGCHCQRQATTHMCSSQHWYFQVGAHRSLACPRLMLEHKRCSHALQ